MRNSEPFGRPALFGKRWAAAPFFVELTAMVLLFSLCAALCLRVFAGAERASRQAAALSAAVLEAQSAAEAVRAGTLSAYAAGIAGAKQTETGWVLPGGEGRTVEIDLSREAEGLLCVAQVRVRAGDTGEVLAALSAAALCPEALP